MYYIKIYPESKLFRSITSIIIFTLFSFSSLIAQTYTISGNLFSDTDALTDSTVDGFGFNAPGNNDIFAVLVDNSNTILQSVAINTDGTYAFTNVAPGDYTVLIHVTDQTVGETAPSPLVTSGWKYTGEHQGSGPGDDGTPDGSISVTVSDAHISSVNFGILNYGKINGYVYQDSNNNGILEPIGSSGADEGLGGVTLALYEADGVTPVTDEFEVPVTTTTLTGFAFVDGKPKFPGFYQFKDLLPGTYVVKEIDPEGYLSIADQDTDTGTYPNDNDPNADTNNNQLTVELVVNMDPSIPSNLYSVEKDNDNEFLDVQSGSISGNVSEDTNGDGTGDTAISGVTISLLDANGEPVNDENDEPITTTTDANGNYSFTNLLPTPTYQVAESDPSNLVSSSDTEGFNNNNVSSITFEPGASSEANNFVDSAPVAISGTVMSDENNNGTADNPLAGVVIELLNSAGEPVLDANGNAITATTQSDGSYEFTNLPKGMYQLRQESQPDGYTSMDDTDGNATENMITSVDATSGDVTGQDFEEVLSSALPIALVSFSAKSQGQNAILNWTTASELNNDRFEIESSLNNESFTKIGEVQGAGSSSEINDYSFVDRIRENRASGRYYRLKQIDYDGAYEYSTVVYVSFDDIVEEINVYPNPSADWLQIDTKDEAEMLIYNLEGKVVKRQALEAGYNSINIAELESGNYLIIVGDSNIKKVIKL